MTPGLQSATLTIRRATTQDAAALAALAEQTFRDTFAAQNSAHNMDLHCRTHYGAAMQAAEIARDDVVTLVAEAAGTLVAYAQLRLSAAPACVPGARPGEIQRFYVDRPWHGQGIAHTFMSACLQALAERACDTVWLGVWEHNPRAIAFYRRHGFVEVGEHCFALGDDLQRDILLARYASAAGKFLDC